MANVTLLESIRFLVEPLDCDAQTPNNRLFAAMVSSIATEAVPWGPVFESAWRTSCNFRIRPAVPIVTALASCILLILLLRNALVRFLRWYAAARGSAFVAVATAALRDLHASSATLVPEATAGEAASEAPGAGAGSQSVVPYTRPAAPHRWYIPPAITAPVVCCACFQPVVAPEGAEGHAQCCELCGMVAHGRCSKAVPHNCRLLVLPLESAGTGGAANGAAEGGGGDGGGALTVVPWSVGHDWRPAGTTLDLILPPADTELLLLGTDDSGTGGQPSAVAAGCTSHGPCSLCLYCGEPCEVGLLAVEPVWRCGACRRFAHVQCWSSLHPGVLSASTRAALEGQALDAEEMVLGSPAGTSPRWAQQLSQTGAPAEPALGPETRPAAGRGVSAGSANTASATTSPSAQPGTNHGRSKAGARQPQPAAAPAAELRPKRIFVPHRVERAPNGEAGAPVGAHWDRQRRCQSLPDIIRGGSGEARGGGSGGGPGGGAGDGLGVERCSADSAAGPSIAAPSERGDGGGAAWAPGGQDRHIRVDWARLARLDKCNPQATLGTLGAMVLPPTAVSLAAGGRLAAPAVADPTPRSTDTSAAGAAAAAPTTAAGAAPSGAAPASGTGVGSGGGGGSRARKKQLDRALRQAQKWYRSHASWSLSAAAAADPAGPDRWRHFRVGALPPGCRPLLVFINPRSGPQAGEQLRRQLLQLLHPLQVVDLAREAPTPALRCWWGVPGLRVLVVGGDGTAGWILGEMDRLAAELAAGAAAQPAGAGTDSGGAGRNGDVSGPASEGDVAGRLPPPPAPVTVLPLGTGNDLARVLGWGGGLAALDARGGVAAVLGEVAAAAPTQLDRWALAITPTPREAAKRGRSFLPRRRKPADGSVPRSVPPPPPSEVKLFNNYLGVGIDSWCALEFHRMRERYPGWFRSQLGNKVWYTGVGARDLLARSCVDLPNRMQLVCDGCSVELPPSAQGILLLNIPSYMGGVDLWGNGVTLQQQQQQQQQQQLQQQQQSGVHPALAGQPSSRDLGHPSSSCGSGSGAGGKSADHCHSPERPAPPHSSNPQGLLQQQQSLPAGAPPRPASGTAMAAAAGPATPNHAASHATTAGRRSGGGGGGGLSASSGVALGASAGTPQGARVPDPAQHALAHSGSCAASVCSAPCGGAGPGGAGVMGTLAAPGGPHCHPAVPQSMSDGVLEVVAVYGAVHLGQLQVGLARATRLCQCRTAVITTRQALPMQVDGEPWMQPAAQLVVSIKGSATMLRRLDLSSATSRLTAAVGDVLDGAVASGTISVAQRQALGAELARKLGAPHAV